MVGVGLAVNDVPIVGQPLAFGSGSSRCLLVCFSSYIARYPITLAHEWRPHARACRSRSADRRVGLTDNADGGNEIRGERRIWIFTLFVVFSDTRPALARAGGRGAHRRREPVGRAAGRDRSSPCSRSPYRRGTDWPSHPSAARGRASGGSAERRRRAAGRFAVGFVAWFLLIAGTVGPSASPTRFKRLSTATLARMTLIPSFSGVSCGSSSPIVSLIVGGQLLLRPGYDIG